MKKNPLRILAIETSSELASAALLNGTEITLRRTDGVTNHSAAILPMLQSLLTEAGIRLADCDAIAYGSGPGSFTGVRTACGVVQGLAFGAGLPVIPVVTLLAMAEACRGNSGAVDVLTVLDARMGEVYWAQYHFDDASGAWQTRIEPTLSAPALIAPMVVAGLHLVGNGFIAYADKFVLPAELLSLAETALPCADAIVRLAVQAFAAGAVLNAEQAQPLYLRNKIALTIAERAAVAASI